MKSLKLRKSILGLMAALTLVMLTPVGANAEWKSNSQGWWYQSGNSYYANGWYQVGGSNWYYFNQSGYMVSNQWIQSGGQWYYLQSDGSMATNKYIGSYYVNASGVWSTPPTTSQKPNRPTSNRIDVKLASGGVQDASYGEALNKSK